MKTAAATPILNLGKGNDNKGGLLGGLLDLNLDLDLGSGSNLDLEEGGKKGGLDLDLDLDVDLDLDLDLGLCGKKTKYFTSAYKVLATPDQVVNSMNEKTGGLKGAKGLYTFGINSDEDVICYKIILTGFEGEYQSPANTATHIHQADKGMSGPPRIAFPNPQGDKIRVSKGCLQGPFTTGVIANGQDTGVGFTLKQIEADPTNFNADVHSSLAVPGAVRGQLKH
ncbi:uncharacterized protein F5Z01DRAFT_510844 [Emericellopsis atlantica]|uniref:CHRD domain-containing protein n=1 Tax=Emericellopsis atlantica TaxID=2614577 RepID=A0A9P8CR82_9HYPO|nr:uncharacterized protein F5Z01DRAFT_510844 [Emericellopsis atlantica]KAG9256453.1 hypothetical protein F5Z01DRAFT_510844 [Emericellopsis atlantica]